MSFNKLARIFSLIFCIGLLSACATKKAIEVEDPAIALAKAEARLKAQGEEESFEQAINLIKTKDAKESALLEAKAIFDTLYQSKPAYLGALINSADISLKLNRLDEAKDLYLDVLKQADAAPTTNTNRFKIHVYNQLGLIGRQQGQFDEAEAYYRQALELDANNATTIKNLAILLDLYRGKLAEAYELYQQYEALTGDADPKIKDWLYDIKNRLPAEEVSDE